MDNIFRVFLCFPIFMVVRISSKHIEDQSFIGRDEQYLRVMIQTLMEQNKRLTLKNKELKKVWQNMQDICKTVNMPECGCDDKHSILSDLAAPFFYTNAVKESGLPGTSDVSLQIRNVKSFTGSETVSILSVTYMSTLSHVTEWVGLRENGGVWRTAGNRNTSDEKIFTSIVKIEEPKDIRDLILFLYNEEESVSVRFNVTKLTTEYDQEIMKPNDRFITVAKHFQAMNNTDLNISAIVHENVSFLKDLVSFEVYFTGVNESSSQIFEIFSFKSNLITVSLSYRSNTTANMIIIVSQEIAKHGGLLTVRFWFPMSGLLKDLYHGPIIKILAPDSEDIVQNNTLGVFPLARQTVVFPPSSTLMCAAMGNPCPNVSIAQIKESQEVKEMHSQTEIIASDTNVVMKILTFNWNQSDSVEGRYVCRASNGNKTTELVTQVILYDQIDFNETKTGVIQNDSNHITLSCMASGKPRPELSLRLYSDHGPSLVNAGEYKVFSEGMFASRVTLTIAAKDGPDYHTIYCVASQLGGNHKNMKIEIFPEGKKTYNWNLYDHLDQMNIYL